MPRKQAIKPKITRSMPAYAQALLGLLQVQSAESDASPSSTLTRMTALAAQILSADHVSVWSWDASDPQFLVCRDALSSGEHTLGQRLCVETLPLYFSHFWHQRFLACHDFSVRSADCSDHWCEWETIFDGQVQSALHVRLSHQGHVLGILRIEHAHPHTWQEDELTFAQLLGDQVVHALHEVDHLAMQMELALASTVFDVSRDAIVIMDAMGIVRKVNPAFTQNTGFEPEEILDHYYPQWVNEGGQADVDFDLICPLVQSGNHWQGELLQRRKHGKAQAVWQTMLSVRNDLGSVSHYIAIETDMSAYKEAQARVHFLSHYDALTGMANRAQLEEYIGHQLNISAGKSESVAVICLDLDDFKKVNLSLGHGLGDQLLGVLARRLERVKPSEGLWARLSGDEFAFAISVADQTEAAQIAQLLTERFNEPFALAEQQIRLTASLGVALYPQDAMDSEVLLRAAQSAMRAVKQSGGNGIRFYTATMNAQAVERLLLENQLAQAVSLGQLVLHYQPQVSLKTGQLIGLEALVRWQHPELGLVMPGHFIPLAEETGLIEGIGDWVLVEACQQAVAWINAGIDMVTMAVNVSAPQFMRQPIRDRVAQVLAETGLPAHMLELELTERIVMHDPAHVRQTLIALSELGVQLSLDDFGTGYSSLSYLQKFPLDKLKIDMSFVRNIAHSTDDLAIAKAIIQLGKTMELTVIAEGIETIEQKHLLAQAGCEEGQGYYYAKPLPVDKITEVLYRQSAPSGWPIV